MSDSHTPAAAVEFRIGEWDVAPSLNRLDGPGGTRTLQPLSMQVLVHLASRPGEVVSYAALIEALWPNSYVGEEAVHRRIADLRQNLGDRTRSPRYIETIPKRGYRLIAPVQQPRHRRTMTMPGFVGAALAVAVVAILVVSVLDRREAREPAVAPGLDAAVAAFEDGDYRTALARFEALPHDVRESMPGRALAAELVLGVDIETSPPGAEVRIRRYGDPAAGWQSLGVTPVSARLPRGTWRLRMVADRRAPVEMALPNPGAAFNNVDGEPFVIELPPADAVPPGMVYVPAFHEHVPLIGFRRFQDLGEFFIGRTEVSNAEYAEFVAAAGYRRPELWPTTDAGGDPFRFEDVASLFVDTTGRPGPAFWTDGAYEPGTGGLPVTGVSWYEAMAYARFRDAMLPTGPHWARAALGIVERKRPLAKALLEVANVDGNAPLPVAEGEAMSTWGALHLVGNVREWTESYSGKRKLALGSSYAGPHWQYALPYAADPLSRLPDVGLRLARYDPEFDIEPLAAKAEPPEAPVLTDPEYAMAAAAYNYETGTVSAGDATLVEERQVDGWLRQRMLLPTADRDDPLPVLLFVPSDAPNPLQAVLFFPPGDSYIAGIDSRDVDIRDYDIEFVVEGGRALVWPILWGTHERFREGDFAERLASFRRAVAARRDEVGRVIDFLESSPRFDGDRIAVLAISYGATFVAPFVLATEPRIDAAVILAGGLAPWDASRVPPAINPNTYWARVAVPTLIAKGVYDVTSASTPRASPLHDTLATPIDDRRFIPYESAHWPLPEHRVRRDTEAWLDRYLGRVEVGPHRSE